MFRRLDKLVNSYQKTDNSTPPLKPWHFIWQNLTGFWPIIYISLALTIISASLEVWLIGYAGRLVDKLGNTAPNELWQIYGTEFILVSCLVIIIRPLVQLYREGINDMVFRPNMVARVRWRLHEHVMRQSLGWFQDDMAGRIAGHVRDAGSSATGAAYQILQTLVYVFVYIIGSIYLMASVDIRLIWPLLIWLCIYIGLMIYAVPKFEQMSGKFQHAYSALNGMLVDTYTNIVTVKLFSNAAHEDVQNHQRFEATRTSFIGLQKIEVVINIGFLFISSLLMVGMVGFSIMLWQAGAATIGLIASSIALSFRISSMAEWLMDSLSSLYGYLGGLRENLKLLAKPIAIKDVPQARKLEINGGAIKIEHIHHHYGQQKGGLRGVSLNIKAGEKIGLVGHSGAGKSTLVNLLLRFYQAERGDIRIDGQDVTQVKQDSLRRHIGMVTQDVSLLHRSIGENIAYGLEGASKDEIMAAAQKAQAHEFIKNMQDGQGNKTYDCQVGERGLKLSGGQRQRIALARVILKNAPILILDEATSALDSELEAAILDILYDVMQGKTVIAIAHRLSTIAQMDRIIVMQDGLIAEQGTHKQLLALDGIYAGLWARQSGGYIAED